jgi:lipopolysaccharide biosynthesis glycosyltransferase
MQADSGEDSCQASSRGNASREDGETLHIACVADADYGPYSGITFWSVIRSNPRMKIHLHLFSDAIREKDLLLIQAMAIRHNTGCTVYDLADRLHSHPRLDRRSRYPRAAFGRIFIPEMFSGDSDFLLYLDCDVICVGSLQDLWDMRYRVGLLAAVPDPWVNSNPDYKRVVGCSPDDVYYNSGVMLLNAAAWRRNNMLALLIDYINRSNPLRYADQDAINAVLSKQIFALESRWNALISAPDMSRVRQQLREAKIIHFCAGFKPWHVGYSLLGGLASAQFRAAKSSSPWRHKFPDFHLRRLQKKIDPMMCRLHFGQP